MRVTVRFFGVVRDFTKEPEVALELADGSTIRDLLDDLRTRYGEPFRNAVLCDSGELKGHVKLFMNDEEVNPRLVTITKLVASGEAADALLYVLPSTAGG